MGDYIEQADVESGAGGATRLIQLADYDDDGEADTAVIEAVIAEAEGLINSYARKLFEVPFNPVPPIIKTMAVKIAVYYLRERRDVITPEARAEQEDRPHLASATLRRASSTPESLRVRRRAGTTATATRSAPRRRRARGRVSKASHERLRAVTCAVSTRPSTRRAGGRRPPPGLARAPQTASQVAGEAHPRAEEPRRVEIKALAPSTKAAASGKAGAGRTSPSAARSRRAPGDASVRC